MIALRWEITPSVAAVVESWRWIALSAPPAAANASAETRIASPESKKARVIARIDGALRMTSLL
jgi:hypothetical protein